MCPGVDNCRPTPRPRGLCGRHDTLTSIFRDAAVGQRRHTTLSASAARRLQAFGAPTGTATTICAGRRCRTAAIVTSIVAPVATPSSTRITIRSRMGACVTSRRYIRARRSNSWRSRAAISSNTDAVMPRACMASVCLTCVLPSPMAPSASSSWPGAPSLRTTSTSNGARRASAMGLATGTPPLGNARTVTSERSENSRSASARCSPA